MIKGTRSVRVGMRRRGGSARVVAGLACCALLAACAGKQRTAEHSPLAPTPPLAQAAAGTGTTLEWTLIAGRRTVVPVDAAMVGALSGNRLRLEGGGTLEVHAYVIRVRPLAPRVAPELTSVAARTATWLDLSADGRPLRWGAEPLRRAEEIRDGAAVLTVEASAATMAKGTAVTELGGRRIAVRRMLDERADPVPAAQEPAPLKESARESAWVSAALRIAESSPLTRWRSRLARGQLLSNRVSALPGGEIDFDNAVIEDLAQSIELQWRLGLRRLWDENPDAARQVTARLCATLDFGGGVIVPAWPADEERLERLLRALLSLTSKRGGAQIAQDWLDKLPTVVAWVCDDAGATDPTGGMPCGAIGVANLTGGAIAAWAEVEGVAGTPEITAVGPWRALRVPVSAGGNQNEEGAAPPAAVAAQRARQGERAVLHVGGAQVRRVLHPFRLPALAPGVVIGPFHRDWRLVEWFAAAADEELSRRLSPWGEGVRLEPGWTTTGLIYRGVDAPVERAAGVPDDWLLFLQLDHPEGAAAGEAPVDTDRGFVRVWFGPLGQSVLVMKVLSDGRVFDESPPAGGVSRDVPRLARTVVSAKGSTCWIPIPAAAIEKDGTLRVGIERVDARGVRTAWPRPLLPWQQEPSRIAFDTHPWGERTGAK